MYTNLAYQEPFQEELIDGKVFMMSPASTNHTFVAGNIHSIFWNYLKGKSCVPVSDGSIVFFTEHNHFVPDFMVVCDPNKIRPDGVHGAPDLVVEVLSPGTMKNDKTHKKDVYAQCGVKEYWLVDPLNKTIEVYYGANQTFTLHDIYAHLSEADLKSLSQQNLEPPVTHFQCSLFDDLDIALSDIFYRTF